MTDYYVNASEAIRMVRAWDKTEGKRNAYTADAVVYLLEHLTPVRANEIRSHGRWIYRCEDTDGIYEFCSECGIDADITHYRKSYTYCPNCGAKMDLED